MPKVSSLIIVVFMFACINLVGAVLEVGQTEEFLYNTIQSAVNSATEYDTVLVHPGRYIENIDIYEKSLTLCSLFLTTGDISYIDSTIIDGNKEDTVINAQHYIYSSVSRIIKISGLTITNGNSLTDHYNEGEGRNFDGGGIHIVGYSYHNSNFSSIEYCKILNNVSEGGGGVYLHKTNMKFTGCEISDNNGSERGGGIYSTGTSYSLEFSTENLNSIYNNSAGKGRDIYLQSFISNPAELHSPLHFDKISVELSEDFSHYFYVSAAIEWDGVINYNETAYERIEADLFVSPTGDDNNSGLTQSDPLKTISQACSILKPRSNGDYNIVRVAPGIYSPDITGEIFPISMDRGTKIIGAGSGESILDGEDQICNFFFLEDNRQIFISGFRCQNLYSRSGWAGTVYITNAEDVTLKDFEIRNVHTCTAGIEIRYGKNMLVEDFIIKNYNYLGFLISASSGVFHNIWTDSLNVTLEIQGQATSMPFFFEHGGYKLSNLAATNSVIPGGRVFQYNHSAEVCDDFVTVNNLLIANCSSTPLDWNLSTVGFFGEHLPQIKFNNMTIVNNTNHQPAVIVKGNVQIRNSIIDNPNTPVELYLLKASDPPYNPGISALDIDYSLVRGGRDALVTDFPDGWSLTWGDNMIDEDPGFAGGDENLWSSYFLAENSPCIDAGVPDTTGYYMSPIDLNGCQRVFGSAVDLGCFEYGAPVPNSENHDVVKIPNNIAIYPNPAQLNNGIKGVTTIEFTLNGAKAKDIRVGVYNLKGQKVRDLRVGESFYNNLKADNSTYSLHWDLKNDRGRNVSSGIYFIRADDRQGQFAITKCCVMK